MSDQSRQAAIVELAGQKIGPAGRVLVRREIRKLDGKLRENENVVNLARGQYQGKKGLVILTDHRLIFVEEGIVRSKIEDFAFDKLSSIQTEKNLMYGQLRIYASGNAAEITNIMPKERAVEVGDYVRDQLHKSSAASGSPGIPASPVQVTEGPPGQDPVERLKQLAELRDGGIITQQDFDDQKARILAAL